MPPTRRRRRSPVVRRILLALATVALVAAAAGCGESDRLLTVTIGTLLEGRTVGHLRRLVQGSREDFAAPVCVSAGRKAVVVTAAGEPGGSVVGGITAAGT